MSQVGSLNFLLFCVTSFFAFKSLSIWRDNIYSQRGVILKGPEECNVL